MMAVPENLLETGEKNTQVRSMRKPRVLIVSDGTDVFVLLCHFIFHRYIDGQVTTVSPIKDYWLQPILSVGVIQWLPTLELECPLALKVLKLGSIPSVKMEIQQYPLI